MDAGIDILGSLTCEVASASFWLKEIQFKKGDLTEFKETDSALLKNKYQFLKPIHLKMNGDIKSNGSSMNGMSSSPVKTNEEEGLPDPKVSLFSPSSVLLDWQQKRPIGPGLINMGNTCFMNAVLQCLSYCPPLVNYLTIDENDHSKNRCTNSGIFCMACQLSLHIKRCQQSTQPSIRPEEIARRLRSVSKNFMLGRQEDAHEYLRHLIDHMCRTTVSSFESKQGMKLDSISKETTAFNRIFGGFLRSQVICQVCKHRSNSYDHFLDLMLDVKNVSSLKSALEKFVRPEYLNNDNAYKCPRCKKKCPATKTFSIHRPPNVLTIQFKRFEFSRLFGGKITKHIEFESTLNMRPYMSEKGEPVVYHLNAVLVHFGASCNSGHYYCFVRNSNGSFYLMDDSRVSQVSLNNVLNQNAYILFYTRKSSGQLTETSLKKNPSSLLSSSATTSSQFIGPKLPNGTLPSFKISLMTNKTNSSNIIPGNPLTNLINSNKLPSNQPKIIPESPVKDKNQPKIIPESPPTKENNSRIVSNDKPINGLSSNNLNNKQHDQGLQGQINSFLIKSKGSSTQSLLAKRTDSVFNGVVNGQHPKTSTISLSKTTTSTSILKKPEEKEVSAKLVNYSGSEDEGEDEEEETPVTADAKIFKGVGHLLKMQSKPRLSDPSKDQDNLILVSNKEVPKKDDDFRLFSDSKASSEIVSKPIQPNPIPSSSSLILKTKTSVDKPVEQGLTTLGSTVMTWDGDVNHVDQTSVTEKRKFVEDDDEYDEEFDRGKTKKVKKKLNQDSDSSGHRDNPFDKYQNSSKHEHGSSFYSQNKTFSFSRQNEKNYGRKYYNPHGRRHDSNHHHQHHRRDHHDKRGGHHHHHHHSSHHQRDNRSFSQNRHHSHHDKKHQGRHSM